MSVDGDLQGVPRILDAISAHMWTGLVMKPADVQRNFQQGSKENDEGVVCLHVLSILCVFRGLILNFIYLFILLLLLFFHLFMINPAILQSCLL